MILDDILDAIRAGRVSVTDHADEEAVDDCITSEEIFFSVDNGTIIEEYPHDQPFPRCLVLGFSRSNQPIHTVWAYNPANQWAVLVTVYRPDPTRWRHWRERLK